MPGEAGPATPIIIDGPAEVWGHGGEEGPHEMIADAGAP